jgi:hypothetical protein
MPAVYKKFTSLVGSKKFFYLILLVFVLESVWVAISARYPMAFDEDFHLGIIKLHAAQWSPFITNQAPLTSRFGALTTDPSYLYHYLMSWPWRLANILFQAESAKIIFLRFIDISLFAWGIVLFKKLMQKAASPAIVNASLLFFILIPVVPLLAGQINYDNLLVPLTALVLLYTVEFVKKLKKNVIDIKLLVLAFSISLLASLVKYAFLPILTAAALYLAYHLIKFAVKKRGGFWELWRASWSKLRQWQQISLLVLFLVSVGLFIKSYGVNVVVYDNLVPQCNQVLSVQQCTAYSPWDRNYNAFLNNKGVDINPVKYTGGWLYGMFERLFFTVNGTGKTANYATLYPLPVIGITAGALIIIGMLLFIRFFKQILRKNYVLGFSLFVAAVYIAALWGRNYHDYLHLGQAVAVNGRYLIPILPIIILCLALGYQKLLAYRPKIKVGLLVITFLLFLEGGGTITYIYASNNDWYWPNDKTAQKLNSSAQKIIKPWIIKW